MLCNSVSIHYEQATFRITISGEREKETAPKKKRKLDIIFTVSDQNVQDLVVLPHIRSE